MQTVLACAAFSLLLMYSPSVRGTGVMKWISHLRYQTEASLWQWLERRFMLTTKSGIWQSDVWVCMHACVSNTQTSIKLPYPLPFRVVAHQPSPSSCSTFSSLLGPTTVCPSTPTLWSSSFSTWGRWNWTAQLLWWFIAGVCERLGVCDHVSLVEGLCDYC